MKAITFLGIQDYKDIIYSFDGKETSPTKLFPKSLCEFFQPEELLVVVTEKAKEKWFDILKKDVEMLDVKVVLVEIPDGHTVVDLWKIFDLLTQNLNEEDEVIFDITHSFRTLPFLSFLAANFLQTAKNVRIKGIYYGAFDAAAEKENSNLKIAPVFDLTPFIELSRWLTATDKFIETGNAKSLGHMLKDLHQRYYKLNSSDKTGLPQQLQQIGKGIDDLSMALLLNRPQEIAEKSNSFQKTIESEKAIAETEKFAKPFAVLLERISEEFKPFRNSDLESQRQLIGWYIKRGQIVQAVMLMREWLISLVCAKCDLQIFDKYDRRQSEELLNDLAFSKDDSSSEIENKFKAGSEWKTITDIWTETVDLRNDVAHFGFRKSARPANAVVKQTENISNKLFQLKEI